MNDIRAATGDQMRAVEDVLHAHLTNLAEGCVSSTEVAEDIVRALGLEPPPRSCDSYKRYAFDWEAFRALRASSP